MSFFWNSRSIEGKLTRLIIVVSTTALILACASFLGYDLYTFREGVIRSLSTEAQIVGTNSVAALNAGDPHAAESNLNALRNSTQILAATIYDAQGKSFAQYTRDAEASARADLQPFLAPGQTKGYWSHGQNILVGSRISSLGKPMGTVYIVAETTDLTHRLEQYGLICICILLFCLGGALLATSRIRHLVTDPLTGLSDTAQIVSRKKDYSLRARSPSEGDELAQLVTSFNDMLEQIQQRDRALEQTRDALEQRVQERTSELMAANKELEAFSYSVAHDLRGPLDSIGNIAYLLRESGSSSEGQNNAELIDSLLDGSRKMASLIDDLLNLSKATSTSLHRVPTDLSEMASGIIRHMEAEENKESPAGKRQVRFIVARGAKAFADEGLICVALENILRNAWKYTSRREIAEIEFGIIEDQPGNPTFFVRDNGAGFDPRYADRLFRPFQRLHSQNEFPGTGVGLATVHRIIQRHGGRIWAKGQLDHGATFYFTLPYAAEA